jgi:hypothetical protein
MIKCHRDKRIHCHSHPLLYILLDNFLNFVILLLDNFLNFAIQVRAFGIEARMCNKRKKMTKPAIAVVQNNFNLKNEVVELINNNKSAQRAVMGIEELEATRSARRTITASKHGLEVICGASCETAAQ